MSDEELIEIRERFEAGEHSQADMAALLAEAETQRAECLRQMEYGIRQHEIAQAMMRDRKLLREALKELFDEATYSGNISTWDGWHITNPRLELPEKTENLVREALDKTGDHP